jgi:hypothetical protein
MEPLFELHVLQALAPRKATDDATTQGTSLAAGCELGGWNSPGPTRRAMLRALSKLNLTCHGPDDSHPLVRGDEAGAGRAAGDVVDRILLRARAAPGRE